MHIIQCHILLFSRVWLNTNISMGIKSAGCKKNKLKMEKLKIFKMNEGWELWRINEEWWKLNDEGWRMMISSGWGVLMTNRKTD